MYLFQNQFIVSAETIQIETKRGIFNRGEIIMFLYFSYTKITIFIQIIQIRMIQIGGQPLRSFRNR